MSHGHAARRAQTPPSSPRPGWWCRSRTPSRSLLSTLSTETSSRAGQRTPAHVHDGRFVIRELNFSLGAVCTEAGVSVDSSELAVAAPPSPGKSYKTSLASSLQMGSHRSSAICRCSRGGFRRGRAQSPTAQPQSAWRPAPALGQNHPSST